MPAKSNIENPYVGPKPFEQKDQDRFFGREREANELLSLVIANRMSLLYAQSGAGKTSLLNAKLLPMLRERQFEVLPVARVRGLIPDDISPEEVSNPFVFNALISWSEVNDDLDQLSRLTLDAYLKQRPHPVDSDGLPAPRIIIFDQFEELFTAYPDRWHNRKAFFNQVARASSGDPLLRVLFVIREDFIAQLDPYLPGLPNQLRSRLRVMRLQQRAALEAIKKPLQGTHRSFDDGVAERLVDELLKINVETESGDVVSVTGEYVEPVQLQVVCENLWNDLPAKTTVITNSQVQEFGDVNEALSAFYESTIDATVAESGIDEGALRRFFERKLLTPAGTRGTVYRGSLQTGEISNDAIDVLENRHIIRGEWRGGSRWYELTHDRFIEPILRSNKKWLSKSVGGQEMLQLLEQKADLWNENGKKEEDLLDEFALTRAENWIASPAAQALDIPEGVRSFINESRKKVDAKTIKKERSLALRYRRFLVVILLVLIPAAFIWIKAIAEYRAADARVQSANEQVLILQESEQRAQKDLEKAAEITAEAIAARDSAVALMRHAEESLTALNQKIASASDSLEEAQYQLESAQEERLLAQEEMQIYIDQATRARVAYETAQAERVEALTDRNEAVEKLNQALSLAIADMAKRQQSLGNDSLAALLAKQAFTFDQQGNNLFEGQVYDALRTSLNGLSADSTTQLGGPQTFYDHRGQVRQVAYSPDGRWLVSGGDNDVVRIRDLRTNQVRPLGGTPGSVRCLAFSPDSRLLAVCKANEHLELWRFTDNGPADTPQIITSIYAQQVVFNQHSDILAVLGADGWLYKWTLDQSDGDLATFLYTRAGFRALASSPDDGYLVAADRTGQLYTWHNWTAQNAKRLDIQPARQVVNAIAFSPDSNTFATGGEDYRLLVWSIRADTIVALEQELLGHLGPINDITFSNNGRLLASASSDKSIHVRSTSDFNRRPRIMQDHDFWVWSVDFSANDGNIATGGGDGTVRIWTTDSRTLVDRICRLLPGGQLTEKQWETYIGNDFDINQYQKPCP